MPDFFPGINCPVIDDDGYLDKLQRLGQHCFNQPYCKIYDKKEKMDVSR